MTGWHDILELEFLQLLGHLVKDDLLAGNDVSMVDQGPVHRISRWGLKTATTISSILKKRPKIA